MEKCHYCGAQHHPMPVCRLGNNREKWRVTSPFQITVCHLQVSTDESGETKLDFSWRECADKAERDGYERRQDLTPTR